MVNRLLARLLPHYCALCGLPSDRDLPLCSDCQADLQPNTMACRRCAVPIPAAHSYEIECGECLAKPPAFDRTLSPWLYDEMLAHLIHRWKFNGQHHLSALLAYLWLDRIPHPPDIDALVPVPLHWRRRLHRGYNQAHLLSRELKRQCAGFLRTQISNELLYRGRATPAQSAMTARARRLNLQGAFTARRPCDNLRLALVDDVFTTGATAGAAAAALRRAGAAHIEIWCLARTPRVKK